eukprot:jgi/Psemu1/328898/estExt_fgenesh1_pg.C_29040001
MPTTTTTTKSLASRSGSASNSNSNSNSNSYSYSYSNTSNTPQTGSAQQYSSGCDTTTKWLAVICGILTVVFVVLMFLVRPFRGTPLSSNGININGNVNGNGNLNNGNLNNGNLNNGNLNNGNLNFNGNGNGNGNGNRQPGDYPSLPPASAPSQRPTFQRTTTTTTSSPVTTVITATTVAPKEASGASSPRPTLRPTTQTQTTSLPPPVTAVPPPTESPRSKPAVNDLRQPTTPTTPTTTTAATATAAAVPKEAQQQQQQGDTITTITTINTNNNNNIDIDIPPLTMGPMVGHTTHDSVTLWAYHDLVKTHDYTMELLLYDSLTDGLLRTINIVAPSLDKHNGAVIATIDKGLAPNTEYKYGMHIFGKRVGKGSFRTAPLPLQPSRFDYVLASCMNHRQYKDQPGNRLGTKQTEWLAQELIHSKGTFKVIVIGSDIMERNWSSDLNNIGAIVSEHSINGVLFHAGDIHRNEFKRMDAGTGGFPYPVTQITSSGIAKVWRRPYAHIFVDTTTIQNPTLTARFYGASSTSTSNNDGVVWTNDPNLRCSSIVGVDRDKEHSCTETIYLSDLRVPQ